jgi:small subunit ribosomal protein S6
MPKYELVFIVQPVIEEEPLNALVERMGKAISDLTGQVAQVNNWGRRRLAYPIRKHREGLYYLIEMDMPATAIRNLEKSIKMMEDVMRYLIVRKEEEES